MHTPDCPPPSSGSGLQAPTTPGCPPPETETPAPTTPGGPPPTTPPGLQPTITIDVMTPLGHIRFTLEVKASDTIDNVKAKIQNQENIMQDQLTLWWDEQRLDVGGQTIGNLGIKHDDIVWLEVSAPRLP